MCPQIKRRLVKFNVPAAGAEKSDEETISWMGIKFGLIIPGSRRHMYWQHALVLPLTYEAWAIGFRIALSSPGTDPHHSVPWHVRPPWADP